ncbi:MAG TPA: NHL repeat-containing protein [Polyangiaceae bacterium]|nr:NHL repeat-containing protein [Polyangiaceae bacterium]
MITSRIGLASAITLFLFADAAGLPACSGRLGALPSESTETTGTVGMQLALPDGSTVTAVSYTITGGPTAKSGTINVGKSSTVSAVIGGLAAGSGYMISLSGNSDGGDSCAGSAGPFTVKANTALAVSIVLTCHQPRTTGGIAISGVVDVCPGLDSINASPSAVDVGGDITITASASPDETAIGFALTYTWTGVTSSDNKGNATLHCATRGSFPITVSVSSGDAACNTSPDPAASATIVVACAGAPTPYAWVGTGGGTNSPLARINTVDGSVTTFNTGPGDAVALDPAGNVWLSDCWNNQLHKVDPASGAVTSYAVPGHCPAGIASDASGNLYVAHGDGGSGVHKIQGSDGSVLWTNPGVCSFWAWGTAVDASGNVWVTCQNANQVVKLKGADGTIVGTYPVGAAPIGVAVDASGNVWVANNAGPSVTKVSGATGAVIGTYSLGNYPWGIAADGFGNVWVAAFSQSGGGGNGYAMKLSGADGSVIGTYAVGATPNGIAMDAVSHVWVVNNVDKTVTELNVSDGSRVGTFNTGISPYGWVGDFTGFALHTFVMK